MSIDRIVMVFAGFVVLASVALGWSASPIFHSPNWMWLTVFVGANLFQAGFTKFCPLAIFLKMFGAKPGQAFS